MREMSGSLTAEEPEGGDSANHSTSSDSQIGSHKIGIKQVDKFMQLMRLIPQGPVLVLANQTSRSMRTDSLPWLGNKGMLASSFNSVTIEPEPFVSFNVKVPSGTFEEIKKTGSFTVFAVNNAFLADAFTGKSEDSDLVLDRMKRSIPAGLARQGFIWWMQCEFIPDKSVTVGDHVIVVGRVARLEEFPGMSGEQALLYSNGSYRLPGPRIKPEHDAHMYAHYAKRRKTPSKIIRLRGSVKMKERLPEGTNTNKDLQVKRRWRMSRHKGPRKIKKPEESLVNGGEPLAPRMSSAPQAGSACKD